MNYKGFRLTKTYGRKIQVSNLSWGIKTTCSCMLCAKRFVDELTKKS